MIALHRKPGWHSRLDNVIDKYRRSEFQFGDFDCAVFARAAIHATTKTWIGKSEWFKYTTPIGAMKVLLSEGVDNLADLAATILPEIHISQAHVGDIAAIPADNEFGFALGVSGGERIFVLGEEFGGLGTVDLLTATRAFKVG